VQARAGHATRFVAAYAPIVYRSHPTGNAFMQPWLERCYLGNFGATSKYLDIDLARQRAAKR
jgi:hypothetical protein